MNKITVVGNLTRDPENKDNYVLIDLAQNQYDKNGIDEKHTHYFRVLYFTKGAEKVAGLLKKGMQITLAGTLKSEMTERDGKHYLNNTVMVNSNDLVLPPKKAASNDDDDLPF
jgi:single-stranded DNA-binding protein